MREKLILCVFVLVPLLASQHSLGEGERPNVLFIAVDDWNDFIGFWKGHPDALTPNIDKLAQNSTVFLNSYCPAPICNPSRAAVLSGLNPTTTGCYGNRQPLRLSEVGRDCTTLGQFFQLEGYDVMGAGKMYHNKFPDPATWTDYSPERGAQAYFYPNGDQIYNDVPDYGDNSFGHVQWAVLEDADEDMADYAAVDYAIKQLGKKQDRPFFLACGFNKPHLPWSVPQKYFDQFDLDSIDLTNYRNDDLEDVPPIGVKFTNRQIHQDIEDSGRIKEIIRAYLATGNFVDAMVGKLIEALERSHHADNTIVVLWSDHGLHLGEKQHWHKSTLWEEATRSPMLIRFPDEEGQVVETPVSLIDLYPTLADLCGLEIPEGLDGVSLKPLIEDPSVSWDRPALTTHLFGNHALRTPEWRYIRYRDGTEELYDKERDPMEWTNLAGKPEYEPILKDMRKKLPKDVAEDSHVVEWPSEKPLLDSVMWEVDERFQKQLSERFGK